MEVRRYPSAQLLLVVAAEGESRGETLERVDVARELAPDGRAPPSTMRGYAAQTPVVPVVVLGSFVVFVLLCMTPKIDHREPAQWHPEHVLARGGASSLDVRSVATLLRAQNETIVALRHNLDLPARVRPVTVVGASLSPPQSPRAPVSFMAAGGSFR